MSYAMHSVETAGKTQVVNGTNLCKLDLEFNTDIAAQVCYAADHKKQMIVEFVLCARH